MRSANGRLILFGGVPDLVQILFSASELERWDGINVHDRYGVSVVHKPTEDTIPSFLVVYGPVGVGRWLGKIGKQRVNLDSSSCSRAEV